MKPTSLAGVYRAKEERRKQLAKLSIGEKLPIIEKLHELGLTMRAVRARELFSRLARKWRDETAHLSALEKRYAHPAYKQIIAMGATAVPLILEEMRREPDWWFDALEELTGADPAKDSESFHQSVSQWLAWGRANQ